MVLLPDLSRRLRAGDTEGGRDAFNRACEMSLALTIPAAVALMVIPIPLVQVLYQRGAFGTDDTMATAIAVAVYGLGLPGFVMQKALQPLFFAREDTRRPFYIALVSLIVNATVAIGLMPYIGFIAAAIGTTLSGWATVVFLWVKSRNMGEAATFDDRFKSRFWRICLASVMMGVVLWVAAVVLTPALGLPLWRYLALFVLIGIGMAAYFISGQMIGAFKLSEFKRAMKRG